MSELTPQARAFLERHATTGQPGAEDRARVRAALGATLARPAALQVLPGTRPKVARERWRQVGLAAACVFVTLGAGAYYAIGQAKGAARRAERAQQAGALEDAGVAAAPAAPVSRSPALDPSVAPVWPASRRLPPEALAQELSKRVEDPLLASAVARYAEGNLREAQAITARVLAMPERGAAHAAAQALANDFERLGAAWRLGLNELADGRPERAEKHLREALEIDAVLVLGPTLAALPERARATALSERRSGVREQIAGTMANECYAKGKHLADRRDYRQACKVWKLGFSFSKGHNDLLRALTNVCTKRAKDIVDDAQDCGQLAGVLDYAVDGDGYREKVAARLAELGCPAVEPAQAPPAFAAGPTDATFLVRQAYSRGERSAALASARACAARDLACAKLESDLDALERLWAKADTAPLADVRRLLELDARLAGDNFSVPARQLGRQVAPALLDEAKRANQRGDYRAAWRDALLVVQLTGESNLQARALLLELRTRAKDLYLRGYVLKDTDAGEAARLFRLVQELTAADDEYHQKAAARLAELERP